MSNWHGAWAENIWPPSKSGHLLIWKSTLKLCDLGQDCCPTHPTGQKCHLVILCLFSNLNKIRVSTDTGHKYWSDGVGGGMKGRGGGSELWLLHVQLFLQERHRLSRKATEGFYCCTRLFWKNVVSYSLPMQNVIVANSFDPTLIILKVKLSQISVSYS